jgi:hypothetical protein
VTVVVQWKDMAPGDLSKVYLIYKIPAEHHLAAGILFSYLGLKEEALAELRRARQVAATAHDAELRTAELEGRANFLSYDFSGGLQMLDWDAGSGSWGIKDGALCGGGPGESTITLQKARYSARGLMLSLEFELAAEGNVFTAELYSSMNDYLGVTVDPRQGVALVSAVGGTPLSRIEKLEVAPGRRHVVGLAVSGDALKLKIDGREISAMKVPRIETINGRLRFKVLDGSATVDNVEILNSAE